MKELFGKVLRLMFPGHDPYPHVINYLSQRDPDNRSRRWWQLVNIGFFINNVPRLVLLCRVRGHRPVVDGCQPTRRPDGSTHQHSLWVVCGRCGVRAQPQGSLPPDQYQIGQRYRGPWDFRAAQEIARQVTEHKVGRAPRPHGSRPGLIEKKPEGNIGGQLLIGADYPSWGAEFKVGNGGSEHTLAFNVHLGRFLALYLHTQSFGEWLVRWLNPVGFVSKETGLMCGWDRGIEWKLWTARDESRPAYPVTATWRWLRWKLVPGTAKPRDLGGGPWWRHGQIRFNWLDNLFGHKLFSYTTVMGPVPRAVRMPERDYLVRLTLQRQVLGRKRNLRPRRKSWTVQWEVIGAGIPVRHSDWKGPIHAGSVKISPASIGEGTWAAEAAANIAADMTRLRTRYGFEPIGRIPVDESDLAVIR